MLGKMGLPSGHVKTLRLLPEILRGVRRISSEQRACSKFPGNRIGQNLVKGTLARESSPLGHLTSVSVLLESWHDDPVRVLARDSPICTFE